MYSFIELAVNAKSEEGLKEAGKVFSAAVAMGLAVLFKFLEWSSSKYAGEEVKRAESGKEIVVNQSYTYSNKISFTEAEYLLSNKLEINSIDEQQILAKIVQEEAPPKVLVRISTGSYTTLTNKQYAFMCDPQELVGLKNIDIVRRLGFDKASMEAAETLLKQGKLELRATLVELPQGVKAVVPTWTKLRTDVLNTITNDERFMDTL